MSLSLLAPSVLMALKDHVLISLLIYLYAKMILTRRCPFWRFWAPCIWRGSCCTSHLWIQHEIFGGCQAAKPNTATCPIFSKWDCLWIRASRPSKMAIWGRIWQPSQQRILGWFLLNWKIYVRSHLKKKERGFPLSLASLGNVLGDESSMIFFLLWEILDLGE